MDALVCVSTFLGVLTVMLLWEGGRPRRPLSRPRRERWMTNLGLTLLNMVLVRVTVGGVAYTAAVCAAEQGIGLLHWRPLPAWAAAVTLLVLDYTLSNFGFSVSWWDRLCGTYRTQLALGQVGMDIGLGEYRTPLHLGQLLLMPFRHRTGRASSTGARAAGLEGRDAA